MLHVLSALLDGGEAQVMRLESCELLIGCSNQPLMVCGRLADVPGSVAIAVLVATLYLYAYFRGVVRYQGSFVVLQIVADEFLVFICGKCESRRSIGWEHEEP